MRAAVSTMFGLFKLRIGFAIMLCALAGVAVTPGDAPPGWRVAILALAVLLSSASAGAFNQYVERDLDARMKRTRRRPFVTGVYRQSWMWPLLITGSAGDRGGRRSLGGEPAGGAACVSGCLYLRRGVHRVAQAAHLDEYRLGRAGRQLRGAGRCCGGGPRAVARAVDPGAGAVPVDAAAFLEPGVRVQGRLRPGRRPDAAGGGLRTGCRQGHPRPHGALVVISLLPVLWGMSWIYLAAAAAGGAWFLLKSVQLVQNPDTRHAWSNFHASLLQLTVLLAGAMLDAWLLGGG
jgi:heme o synthase